MQASPGPSAGRRSSSWAETALARSRRSRRSSRPPGVRAPWAAAPRRGALLKQRRVRHGHARGPGRTTRLLSATQPPPKTGGSAETNTGGVTATLGAPGRRPAETEMGGHTRGPGAGRPACSPPQATLPCSAPAGWQEREGAGGCGGNSPRVALVAESRGLAAGGPSVLGRTHARRRKGRDWTGGLGTAVTVHSFPTCV